MELTAISSAAETAWWITLGVGLIVALVVLGLLEALRRTVDDVEESVDRVWMSGKRVAQNTQMAQMLVRTKELGAELRKETERHAELAARRR